MQNKPSALSKFNLFRGHYSVACGGFPCQDLSIAGKRGGLKASRSGLFFDLARVIRETEPAWFVIENVPGLLSSHGYRDMRIVLRTLTEIRSSDGRRYCIAYRILDSRFFGVAQRRRRVFVVGSLGNTRAIEVLFESEGMRGDTEKKRETRGGIAPTIGRDIAKQCGNTQDRALIAGFLPGQGAEAGIGYEEGISPTLKQAGSGSGELPAILYEENQRSELRETGANIRASRGGRNFQMLVAPTLGASGAGMDRPGAQGNDFQFCIPTIRLDHTKANWDGIGENEIKALQATNSVGWAVCAPTNPDRVRETSGLPGQLDSHFEETSDSPRYRSLGNAVTVNVIRWIARRINIYSPRKESDDLRKM